MQQYYVQSMAVPGTTVVAIVPGAGNSFEWLTNKIIKFLLLLSSFMAVIFVFISETKKQTLWVLLGSD